MKNPRDIFVIEPGYSYDIPTYEVTDGNIDSNGNVRIDFCRGDKVDATKPRQTGIFIESLLEVCRHRLQEVNTGVLSTRETALAITKIEEAILWLEKRSNDRKVRGVEGTYQK